MEIKLSQHVVTKFTALLGHFILEGFSCNLLRSLKGENGI